MHPYMFGEFFGSAGIFFSDRRITVGTSRFVAFIY